MAIHVVTAGACGGWHPVWCEKAEARSVRRSQFSGYAAWAVPRPHVRCAAEPSPRRVDVSPGGAGSSTEVRMMLRLTDAASSRSGRPGSLLTLAPHRSGRAGSAASGSSTDGFATRRRVPAGPGSQAMATAIPKACLASSAIRVVTWRRDPTSVCWPSFPPPVPPAGAPFPPRGLVGSIPPLRRYYETLRLLAVHPPALRCLRPAVPSEHLRLRSVGRQVLRPRPRAW